MFDSDGRLKIIDFGSSAFMEKGLLNSRVGTEPYMAPEIREGAYDGYQVDVFSLGVILFMMLFGYPPFMTAKSNDPLYSCLSKPDENSRAKFWSFHKKRRPSVTPSEDFKDLVGKMVAVVPGDRPTLQGIREHPWCKGAIADIATLMREFVRRANNATN